MESRKPPTEEEGSDARFFAFRHGKAEYKLNMGTIRSNNPEGPSDPRDQDFENDLTPEGRAEAREKAEEFFSQFDPNKEVFYFFSSDLVRALETANIFRQAAKEQGFEIVSHQKTGTELAKKIGEGDIRTVKSLSLGVLPNTLVEFIFHPQNNYMSEMLSDEAVVSEDTRKKWEQARRLIEEDNKGTWGRNFVAHSESVKQLFPQLRTAEDNYKSRFKQMVELVRHAAKKAREDSGDKRVIVLGFSHENSFVHFLGKYFDEAHIDNCEAVEFKVENGKVRIFAKDKEITLE